MNEESKNDSFAIFAEVKDCNTPLFLTDLTFAQLIDEVVVPYESDAPFFIDGVPLKKDKIKKLKIIELSSSFNSTFHDMHWRIRQGDPKESKIIADQYHIRLEALLRESGIDVTSQVIKAFDSTIRPKLKDYLPNREELIKAAIAVFIEGLKFVKNSS